jgi:hypothetical protein
VKKSLIVLLFFSVVTSYAQDSLQQSVEGIKSNTNFKARKWLVGGLNAATYGGSFAFLSTAWYKDYPRRSFHTFNDAGEWQQVDKVGHAWTTYHTSRFTTDLWRWAGVENKKALLYGTGTSLLYMMSIEYLDGHSTEWGWSWTDIGANFFGAALYASQDLGWGAQKISFKFSSHYKNYGEPALQNRADDLYGSSFQGRLLKDYNAQTYWLSANVKSFFPQTTLPAWLNVAVGYGADGMFGGYENIARSKTDGSVSFDRRDIKRYRQWYLAPDVDLTKIKTKSGLLRTLFSVANVLKFPAPALEFSNGKFRFKAIAF